MVQGHLIAGGVLEVLQSIEVLSHSPYNQDLAWLFLSSRNHYGITLLKAEKRVKIVDIVLKRLSKTDFHMCLRNERNFEKSIAYQGNYFEKDYINDED